jgi:GH25 family lysozyme M1 (1,4-beta-N-acetylmuramidase)
MASSRSTPDSDGPDISHWNPISDWNEIPEFDLWCMKATEGRSFRSPVFETNWAKCVEKNVKYLGAYHWIRSDSSMEAQVNNLAHAINDVGGLQDGQFIMLDWETTPGIRNVYVSEVEEWLALAEGMWPGKVIVYASDWVPGFKTWRAKYPNIPLWYANYRLVNDERGGKAETDMYGADVWQWTSSADVPGFADDTIDMNDVLDWSWFATLRDIDDTDSPKQGVKQPAEVPWPPYAPPTSWSLLPLAKNKPDLRATPVRNTQSIWHVTYLQDVLKFKAGQRVTTDGWFGSQTEFAVRQLQKFFGLTVDGWVGPQTWAVIDYLTGQ